MATIMEKKRERTQAMILQAAQQLISTQGFEETSMESIAERAEIATGTLYNYYGSKSALLIAIYASLTKQVLADKPERSAKPLTAETALADLTAVLQYFSQSVMLFPKVVTRRLYSQMFVLEMEDLAELSALDMEMVATIFPILGDMVEAELLNKDADLEQVAMMLYGSLMIIHQTYIMLEDMTEAQLADSISSHVKMQFFGLLPRE